MSASKPRLFTLIEMLVVVAIIAILAALLAPSLQKALQRAKGAACMGGPVKGIGYMIGMYANDFNDCVPPTCGDNSGHGAKWFFAFKGGGYLKNGLEMWCPVMPFERYRNWNETDYYVIKGWFIDAQTYGCMATAIYSPWGDTSHQYGGFFKFGKLKRPGKQIFAGDSAFNLKRPIGTLDSGSYIMRPSGKDVGPDSSNGSEGRVDARHANCAALVNFGGNAELFQFIDREQPWLNAPFGQTSSQEYRMRCSNNP